VWLACAVAIGAVSPATGSAECAQAQPIKKSVVRAIGSANGFRGQALPDGSVALVGTTSSPGSKTYYFQRVGGKWRGFLIAERSSPVGVYYSRVTSRVFVWSMSDEEGPGASFDGLRVEGRGKAKTCLTLAFPSELNKPSWANEYLELVAFNIDSRGVGSLIGKADVEREGKEITWVYRYGTESIGSTWSGPEKLQEIPELTGNFEAFKNADLKKFVDDLTRNAVR